MNWNNRGNDIKERQLQNKKLEEQTKRMEEELEKIKRIKQIQIQRMKMQYDIILNRKELDQLKLQEKGQQKQQKKQSKQLRNYGNEFIKKNQVKMEKKVKKMMQTYIPSSQEEPEDDNGQNLKYFLSVIGLSNHYDTFSSNKIMTLKRVKQLKQPDLEKYGIPVKDQLKITKKLRSMGI